MKTNASSERLKSLKKHQTEMKNLSERNKNEIDKIKNSQVKQKGDLRLSHRAQLNTIQNQHDIKLHKNLLKNEEMYSKLKENLEKVKTVTDNEKKKIQDNFIDRKKDQHDLFSAQRNSNLLKNQLQITDLNQEANIQLQKLQRKINSKEQELKNNHTEVSNLENSTHQTKMNMSRDTYNAKQLRSQDKFQNALLKQKTTHTNQLAREERKHQHRLKTRGQHFTKVHQKVESDGANKKIAKQKKFEKDYKVLNTKQEIMLKNLVGKKETLIHDLRSSLTKEYKIGLEQAEDQFYSFGRIDSKVTEQEDKSGYIIKIPVAQHEAKNIDMRASERTLKITMQREYEFQKDDQDSTDKISKVESFVSKMSVKNIIDPKTITKDYKDGFVIFKIKNA